MRSIQRGRQGNDVHFRVTVKIFQHCFHATDERLDTSVDHQDIIEFSCHIKPCVPSWACSQVLSVDNSDRIGLIPVKPFSSAVLRAVIDDDDF